MSNRSAASSSTRRFLPSPSGPGILVLTLIGAAAGWFIVHGDYEWNHEEFVDDPLIVEGQEEIGRSSPEAVEQTMWMYRDPVAQGIRVGMRSNELDYASTLPKHVSGASAEPIFIWSEAGPNNIGGRTRAVAVDVADSETVLAGGVSGGIWKSEDDGESWRLVTAPGDQLSVTSLAQDPRAGHTNVWYAVGGEAQGQGGFINYNAPRYAIGLYRSTDNGDTWALVPGTEAGDPTTFDTPFDFVNRVVVSPTTGSVFVANNASGVYQSNTGDAPYNLTLGSVGQHAYADVAVGSDGSLVAVLSSLTAGGSQTSSGGVYRSEDDGQTWTNITPTTFPSTHQRSIVVVAPSNPAVAYVLTFVGRNATTSVEDFRFHKLDLQAGTSEDRTANLPNYPGISAKGSRLNSFSGYTMMLAVKPDHENFVLLGGIVPYRSTDGWATPIATYEQARIGGFECAGSCPLSSTYGPIYPEHYSDQHAMVFDPANPDIVWSAHDGGLSVSSNITAPRVFWRYKNNGYNVSQFYGAFISNEPGDGRIGGGLQDYGSQYVFDRRTSPTDSPDYTPGQRLTYDDGTYGFFTDDYVLLGASSGQLRRLRYQNAEKTQVESELEYILRTNSNLLNVRPSGATGFKFFIHPFAVDPVDKQTVFYPDGSTAAVGATIWRSTNINSNAVTSTWERLDNLALPFGWLYTTFGTSIEPAHRLYLGASAVTVTLAPPKVFRFDESTSATGGLLDISIPNVPAGAYVRSIAVNPEDADELLVVLSNYNIIGLYHSTDGGQTYAAVEGNLEGNGGNGPSLRSASILPLTNFGDHRTVYLLGTSVGLFSTTNLDGMNTRWAQEATELTGNVVVDHVTSRPSDGRIVIGTHGRGLFVGDLDVTSVATEADARLPTKISLAGAFPNPFQATTQLGFELPTPGRTTLTVYDVLGRRVATLLEKADLNAGTHYVMFDGTGLASGKYLVRLESMTADDAQQRHVTTSRSITLIH